jgi:potassium-transporting ATPase KdpC subunit
MKNIIIALKIFIVLTLITGIIYPLVITGFAQIIFPIKANGSLLIKDNKIIGSELIGQRFTKPEFFWGRPSAIGNNPMPSGGSNLNPVGNTFKEQFLARVDTIRKYHGNIDINSIPKDLLFASASGVDAHISPEAAYFQFERIAKARNFNKEQKEQLMNLINISIEHQDFFILGEKRVNILKLNLRLDEF